MSCPRPSAPKNASVWPAFSTRRIGDGTRPVAFDERPRRPGRRLRPPLRQHARARFGQHLEAPAGIAREHDDLAARRPRGVLTDEQTATVGGNARRGPVGLHASVGLPFFVQRRFGDRPTRVGVGGALEHELASRGAATRGGERHALGGVRGRGHVERQHLVGPGFARFAGGSRRPSGRCSRVGRPQHRLGAGDRLTPVSARAPEPARCARQ